MPRKSIIEKDQERITTFLGAIKLGMSQKKACDFALISEAVLYVWIDKAEQDLARGKTAKTSKYVEFLEQFKKAKADFQAIHLARITKASDDGSWQASAWLLERRCPDDYAVRHDIHTDVQRIIVENDVPSITGEIKEDNNEQ